MPGLAILGLAGPPARASVSAVDGSVSIETTPHAPPTDDVIYVFEEQQGVPFVSSQPLDFGSIPAGTLVDSHYVQFDPASASGGTAGPGSITFDGPILGVVTSTAGLTSNLAPEVAATSDQYFGLEDVIGPYPSGANPSARGLGSPQDALAVNLGSTVLAIDVLEIPSSVGGNVDGFRVLTASCQASIRYDALQDPGSAAVPVGMTYDEAGMRHESFCAALHVLGDGDPSWSGSTAMHLPDLSCDGPPPEGAVPASAQLTTLDGSAFDVCSMTLAERVPGATPWVTFFGEKARGRVAASHRLDGLGTAAFTVQSEPFTPVGLGDLERLFWRDHDVQWDDICLCASAPPPPASCVEAPSDLEVWWTGDGCFAWDWMHELDSAYVGEQVCVSDAKVGTGAHGFNGTDSAIQVPDDPSVKLRPWGTTIDFWIRSDVANQTAAILHKGAAYQIYLVNGLVEFAYCGSSLCSSLSGPPVSLAPDTWHFVAVRIVAPGTITIHVDGAESSGPALEAPLATSDDLFIGAASFGPQPGSPLLDFFEGALDEIEIFQRHLSAAEVESIREAGDAGKCKYLDGVVFGGNPQGGGVTLSFAHVPPFDVPTSPGDSLEAIVQSLAQAIRLDATLDSLGISAIADGTELVVANAVVQSVTTTDPGLQVVLQPGGTGAPPPPVPALSADGRVVVVAGILAATWLLLARFRPTAGG